MPKLSLQGVTSDMGRVYRKKLGGHHYQNYSENSLQKALADIKAKNKSIRQAAEYYKIPKSTLSDKIRERHPLTPGAQTVLTKNEEDNLVQGLLKAAEWGCPLTRLDVRYIVKSYLDRQGKRIKQFDNNMPGLEWYYGFSTRNRVLTERMAENIKRCRAELNSESIQEYFINLQKVVEGVDSANIVNYDETNFADDPGRKKVLGRKGCKRLNRIIDSSKQSTSVMMAATASGTLLAPYVVYKSTHLYPTWVEKGPPGTVYNRTKSGWFEQETFEDWFQKIALPYLKRLEGKKVLIGDNLSSHLSLHVIQECENNDIQFVLLPPNATHLLQPLDVAFFAPMKKAWRKCLEEWKLKNRGVLPKSEFPALLNKCLESIQIKASSNISAGFRACGIRPFNPDIILQKLPKTKQQENEGSEHWSDSFVELLSQRQLEHHQEKKKEAKDLTSSREKVLAPKI